MRFLAALACLAISLPVVAAPPSLTSEELGIIVDFRDRVEKSKETERTVVASLIVHERVDGWVEPVLLTESEYKELVANLRTQAWTFHEGRDNNGVWLARRYDFFQCDQDIPDLGIFLIPDPQSGCRFGSILYRVTAEGELVVRLVEGMPRQPSPAPF